MNTTSDQVSSPSAAAAFSITFMPGLDPAPGRARFGQAAPNGLSFDAFDPEQIAQKLKAGTPLVVVYQNASHYVAAGLAAGKSASESLKAWQAEARRVLRVWTGARRKVTLVEEETLLRSSSEDLERLTAKLGDAALATPDDGAYVTDTIFSLLARQAVHASPEAQELDVQLEAASLPAPDRLPALKDVDAAAKMFQTLVAEKTRLSADTVALKQQTSDLTKQTAELTRESEGLKKQTADLTQQTKDLKKQTEDLTQEAAGLKTQKAALTQQTVDLTAQLKKGQAENADLIARTEAITTERDLFQNHLTELHSEILGRAEATDALSDKLLKAEGQLQDQTKALAAIKAETIKVMTNRAAEIETLTAERDILLSHLAELKTDMTAQACMAEALSQALLEAEARNSTLTKAHDELRSQSTAQAKSQAKALADAKSKAETERRQLTAQLAAQTATAKSLTDEVKQANARIKTAQSALTRAQAEDALLKAHVAELQVEAQSRAAEAATLTSQLGQLTDELAALRKSSAAQRQALTDEMTAALTATRSERDDARKTVAALETKIGALEAHRDRLNEEKSRQEARANDITRELADVRDTWHEILKQSEGRELALRNSLEAISQEYGKLIASRSWKVTEPLRAANALLRRTQKET